MIEAAKTEGITKKELEKAFEERMSPVIGYRDPSKRLVKAS